MWFCTHSINICKYEMSTVHLGGRSAKKKKCNTIGRSRGANCCGPWSTCRKASFFLSFFFKELYLRKLNSLENNFPKAHFCCPKLHVRGLSVRTIFHHTPLPRHSSLVLPNQRDLGPPVRNKGLGSPFEEQLVTLDLDPIVRADRSNLKKEVTYDIYQSNLLECTKKWQNCKYFKSWSTHKLELLLLSTNTKVTAKWTRKQFKAPLIYRQRTTKTYSRSNMSNADGQ